MLMAFESDVYFPCDLEQWTSIKERLLKIAYESYTLNAQLLIERLGEVQRLVPQNKYEKQRTQADSTKSASHKSCFTGLDCFLAASHGDETEVFFCRVLPYIIHKALQIEQVRPAEGIKIVGGKAHAVSLPRHLVTSLLACSFLCLWPYRQFDRSARLNPINFDEFFAPCKTSESQRGKLKCVLHCFDTLSMLPKAPTGNLVFHRQVSLGTPQLSDWLSCDQPLCHVTVFSTGGIEDSGPNFLQVDFANRKLGGGVLRRGCVQEEIRFCTCPELISGMLFQPEMGDNEAIIIQGFENFSHYKGCSNSFRYAGPCHDSAQADESGNMENYICAIDATSFKGKLTPEDQYKLDFVLRELHKAYTGFNQSCLRLKPDHSSRQSPQHQAALSAMTSVVERYFATLSEDILTTALQDTLRVSYEDTSTSTSASGNEKQAIDHGSQGQPTASGSKKRSGPDQSRLGSDQSGCVLDQSQRGTNQSRRGSDQNGWGLEQRRRSSNSLIGSSSSSRRSSGSSRRSSGSQSQASSSGPAPSSSSTSAPEISSELEEYFVTFQPRHAVKSSTIEEEVGESHSPSRLHATHPNPSATAIRKVVPEKEPFNPQSAQQRRALREEKSTSGSDTFIPHSASLQNVESLIKPGQVCKESSAGNPVRTGSTGSRILAADQFWHQTVSIDTSRKNEEGVCKSKTSPRSKLKSNQNASATMADKILAATFAQIRTEKLTESNNQSANVSPVGPSSYVTPSPKPTTPIPGRNSQNVSVELESDSSESQTQDHSNTTRQTRRKRRKSRNKRTQRCRQASEGYEDHDILVADQNEDQLSGAMCSSYHQANEEGYLGNRKAEVGVVSAEVCRFVDRLVNQAMVEAVQQVYSPRAGEQQQVEDWVSGLYSHIWSHSQPNLRTHIQQQHSIPYNHQAARQANRHSRNGLQAVQAAKRQGKGRERRATKPHQTLQAKQSHWTTSDSEIDHDLDLYLLADGLVGHVLHEATEAVRAQRREEQQKLEAMWRRAQERFELDAMYFDAEFGRFSREPPRRREESDSAYFDREFGCFAIERRAQQRQAVNASKRAPEFHSMQTERAHAAKCKRHTGTTIIHDVCTVRSDLCERRRSWDAVGQYDAKRLASDSGWNGVYQLGVPSAISGAASTETTTGSECITAAQLSGRRSPLLLVPGGRRASEPITELQTRRGSFEAYTKTNALVSQLPVRRRGSGAGYCCQCANTTITSRNRVLDWLIGSSQSGASKNRASQSGVSKNKSSQSGANSGSVGGVTSRKRTTSSHLDWFAQDLLLDAFADAFQELFVNGSSKEGHTKRFSQKPTQYSTKHSTEQIQRAPARNRGKPNTSTNIAAKEKQKMDILPLDTFLSIPSQRHEPKHNCGNVTSNRSSTNTSPALSPRGTVRNSKTPSMFTSLAQQLAGGICDDLSSAVPNTGDQTLHELNRTGTLHGDRDTAPNLNEDDSVASLVTQSAMTSTPSFGDTPSLPITSTSVPSSGSMVTTSNASDVRSLTQITDTALGLTSTREATGQERVHYDVISQTAIPKAISNMNSEASNLGQLLAKTLAATHTLSVRPKAVNVERGCRAKIGGNKERKTGSNVDCAGGTTSQYLPIATGNWGCGAYRGDPQLKALLQWVAASRLATPQVYYYTFGEACLTQLGELCRQLEERETSVSQLLQLVVEYCQLRQAGNQLPKKGTKLQQGGNPRQQAGNQTQLAGNQLQQTGKPLQQAGNQPQQAWNQLHQAGNQLSQTNPGTSESPARHHSPEFRSKPGKQAEKHQATGYSVPGKGSKAKGGRQSWKEREGKSKTFISLFDYIKQAHL